MTAADKNVEYRVTWRRADWAPGTKDKSRRFARRVDLNRFIDNKLLGDERPELAPYTVLRIDKRRVGPWKPGA